MPSFPSQTPLSSSPSAPAIEYSSVPTPLPTSPLLDGAASPDVESGFHKESEPARPSLSRRAWQKFTSFKWRMDLEAIATVFCVVGLVALALALGVLISFGLNVLSTYAGGHILHYDTPIRAIFNHAVVTGTYARVALAGCAIVNVALLFVAPTVTLFVDRRHGDDAAEVACWGTLALGMLVGSATAASLGIVVLPVDRAPEGLSAVHALAAGSLGTVVVGIPVFVLGILSCWACSSSDSFWWY